MVGRGVVVAGALALALAAWAGSATAAIVVGKGIAGVELGDSQRQVREALGKPSESSATFWRYTKRGSLAGGVSFDKRRRVIGIATRAREQRTAKGIGPGSSIGALRKAYPKARCGDAGFLRGWVKCTVTLRVKGVSVPTKFLATSSSAPFFQANVGSEISLY